MANMVCSEVDLNAIFCDGALGDTHDAGTVDDDVELRNVGPGQKFRGCFSDGFLA